MTDNRLEKYKGIFPAFYACYDEQGKVSPERAKKLARYLWEKGIQGLYVGGSSGECIYQRPEERKLILEAVVSELKGTSAVIIAHVACNNTEDSQELARHAESLGVDAIAAIPPIYFHLPEYSVAQYWNDISAAAPNTDFVIYNIPQLAGTALTPALYRKMLENPRVIGVKNSSMPTQDIIQFKDTGDRKTVVFNGPDEQLISGLAAGADGGIGGTYGVMPEVYLQIRKDFLVGNLADARQLQYRANRIIKMMTSCHGNMYAVIKEILKYRGVEVGSVRAPLAPLAEEDRPTIEQCVKEIDQVLQLL